MLATAPADTETLSTPLATSAPTAAPVTPPPPRIDVANSVHRLFTDVQIEQRGGWVYVSWEARYATRRKPAGKVEYRWQTRGQDFYPVWYSKWPHGGTSCTAMANLIRWVQDKPVLPLSTWRYWAGDGVKLLSMAVVDELGSGGYPETVNCVLCQQPIVDGMDWWSLKGVTGPCCGWQSGCRQKGVSQ